MPADNKLGDEGLWASRERVVSADLNALANMREVLFEMFGALFDIQGWGQTEGSYGGILRGLQVTQDNPTGMSVRLNAGIGLGWNDDWYSGGRSRFRPLLIDSGVQTLPIGSNSSGSTRVDLVQVQPAAWQTEKILVDIFNPTTKKFDPDEVFKRFRMLLDKDQDGVEAAAKSIVVKQGTPGAGAPSPDPFFVPLAEITVINGETEITNAEIEDVRRRLVPSVHPRVIAWIDRATGAPKVLGTGETMKKTFGGADITFVSNPSAGEFNYTLSGFSQASDDTNLVHVNVSGGVTGNPDGKPPIVNAVYGGPGNSLQVNITDHAGTFIDADFRLDIVDLLLGGF